VIAPVIVLMLAPPSPASPPTWKDVRPILEQHCAECHRPDGPAPFSLLSPETVGGRALFIKEVTSRGLMPPWGAGDAGLPLRGKRALSEREIATLAAWAETGHIIGEDRAPARPPQPVPLADDLRVQMPESWDIPAEGQENWGRRDRDKWTFAIPIGNEQPLRVSGLFHETTAPKAVHAVTYLADTTGAALWNDQRNDEPGSYMTGDVRDHPSGELGGTGVGARMLRLPEGYHWEIPAQADLAMEVHYRPIGRPVALKDSVRFSFAETEASRPLRTLLSMVRWVDVAAGETATVEDQFVIEEDVDLVAVTPRAMGVCNSLRLEADLPGGDSVVLFDAPDWDPHWRRMFVLEEAFPIPAGTVVRGTWTLANTEDNHRNPFIPVERLTMARRTGAVSMLLHVAADDDEADDRLRAWHRELMRSRIR